MLTFHYEKTPESIALHVITPDELPTWAAEQSAHTQTWLESLRIKKEKGNYILLPSEKGGIASVLVISDRESHQSTFAKLAQELPPYSYHIEKIVSTDDTYDALFGWGLGSYHYNRYKTQRPTSSKATLFLPDHIDGEHLLQELQAITFVRDLITTPASDLGPAELATEARNFLEPLGFVTTIIVDDALLANNYPAIHAVGRASTRPPLLLDLTWGNPMAPKVTLVGKGVCFDTGGLDLKTSAGMLLMKKDMGGAAHVLGLAYLIAKANMPIRLRVLIAAVENSVSGNAMRPSDVIKMRSGLTVEVGNTDAEGRLVLADCLAEACAEAPALIIDCATLTGAARVALGPDLPAFFCNSDPLAHDLLSWSERVCDPLWRLPLFQPYAGLLKSPIADIASVSSSPYAGALVAALFLEKFLTPNTPWIHIDMMAWNTRSLPGKPEGGEAQGLRALYYFLKDHFSVKAPYH